MATALRGHGHAHAKPWAWHPKTSMDKARIPVKLHRRVCLIHTEDALLAEELLADRKLAPDLVGRLADNVLLVRAGRVDAVVQEMQRLGHTPQVSTGTESP